jgi:hypothetical protein
VIDLCTQVIETKPCKYRYRYVGEYVPGDIYAGLLHEGGLKVSKVANVSNVSKVSKVSEVPEVPGVSKVLKV